MIDYLLDCKTNKEGLILTPHLCFSSGTSFHLLTQPNVAKSKVTRINQS